MLNISLSYSLAKTLLLKRQSFSSNLNLSSGKGVRKMKDLFVYDSFKTVQAAEDVADHLVELGVPRQAIIIGAERDLRREVGTSYKVVNGIDLRDLDHTEETSLWDRIVGIFQSEEDAAHEQTIDFDGYRSALALGDVLIFVEEEFRLMIDKTVTVDEVSEPSIPTEADNRIERGGSFASEDLSYHAPDDLAAPLDEMSSQDPLINKPKDLDETIDQYPLH